MNNKNYILLSLFLFICLNLFSQEKEQKYNRYFAKDQLSFSLNATHWIQSDKQAKLTPRSLGCNIQMMYPIIGKNNNIAFAIGFGGAFQNYFTKQFITTTIDSVQFDNIPDRLDSKSYKLNTNYLTLPFELRFRTNPKGLSRLSTKFYPGFRIGYLINSKTKYVGKDKEGMKVKEKEFYIRHIPTFDYGVSLKVGRGRFLAHGYYSLSTLFNTGTTYRIVPFEIGVTIILL